MDDFDSNSLEAVGVVSDLKVEKMASIAEERIMITESEHEVQVVPDMPSPRRNLSDQKKSKTFSDVKKKRRFKDGKVCEFCGEEFRTDFGLTKHKNVC